MPRRWLEIPESERLSWYWAIVPDNKNEPSITQQYEIAFVRYTASWRVQRFSHIGDFAVNDFMFLFMLNKQELPELRDA
jgi:hypothetical protein